MSANTEMMRLDSVEKEKMEGILAAQTLPKTTSTDNGKVLKVSGGKWTKGTISELPAVSADDNGKILKVVDGAWAVVSEVSAE